MSDVFISYKRRLRPRVEQIANELERLGLSVWFDAELEPGTSFSGEISSEVRSAKCVLVCWTNDAFPHGGDENGWVVGEATIGRQRKALVATTLEPTDLDPPWNTIHAEDLANWTPTKRVEREPWLRVLEAIGRHVGRQGLAALDEAIGRGTVKALSRWLEDYPNDPAATFVTVEIQKRRRPRKRRLPAAVGGGEQPLATSFPGALAPTDVLAEPGKGAAPVTDFAAIEAQLVDASRVSIDTDGAAAWLERDLALTEDLSFSKTKLEDAVAAALEAEHPTGPSREPETVPQVVEKHDYTKAPWAPIVERDVASEPATRYLDRHRVAVGSLVAVAASVGVAIASFALGVSTTSWGNVVQAVVCPAIYGGLLLVPARRAGVVSGRWPVMLCLVTPVIAFVAGFAGTVAQAAFSGTLGEIAFGAVGSIVGCLVLLWFLAMCGAIKVGRISHALIASCAPGLAVGLLVATEQVGIARPLDAGAIMLLWELVMSVVVVAFSKNVALEIAPKTDRYDWRKGWQG